MMRQTKPTDAMDDDPRMRRGRVSPNEYPRARQQARG